MKEPMKSEHWNDKDGNPAGGRTTGTGFTINWQNGPLGRGPEHKEPNGAFVEEIIDAVIGRLAFYQRSKFRCAANGNAIIYLRAALGVLAKRTKERGVEGTHQA